MKKSSSLALGNFFKTKKQILKADIQKLIKTNQLNHYRLRAGRLMVGTRSAVEFKLKLILI
ncbi:MAG TPA: hypothetical protein LFV66_01945 [Rickettsia endosymbiont of Bembidion lapponicum]|nr:hypothetical protein [Rickettsia endosymbiont of Bembidion lapponicum]